MNLPLRLRFLAVLLCCCALPACGTPTSQDGSLDLPACGKPPSEDPTSPPPGALMPPTARLTATREGWPRKQLTGYVESTPAAVREWVEAQPDLDVLGSSESAERVQMLVTDGTWRTYLTVRSVCLEGSLFTQIITAADSGAPLPSPWR